MSWTATTRRGIRRHWPMLVLVLAGAALRAVVTVGFRPVLWYLGDSISYLSMAVGGPAYPWRPQGYSFLLLILRPLHHLAAVAVVQHGLGLAVGVLIYAVCLRVGLRRWVATLAAVPVLFDAWEVTTEQYLLSETFFIVLLTVALAALVWWQPRRPPPAWAAGLAGLLVGLAADVRTICLFLIVPVVAVLLLRRARVLRTVLAAVLFGVPLVAYAGFFDSQFGWFGISPTGLFAYGRVSGFASCAGVSLSPDEQQLCPTSAEEKMGTDFFLWDPRSPFHQLPGSLAHQNSVGEAFAIKMVEHHPGDYLHAVWEDFQTEFSPDRAPSAYDVTPTYATLPALAQVLANHYQGAGNGQTHPTPGIERWFAWYQRHGFMPGVAFLVGLALAAAGVVFGRDEPATGLRSATVGFGLAAAILLLVPPFVASFDYRYLVPALPPLCVAAATGATLLANRVSALARRRARAGAHFPGSPPVDGELSGEAVLVT
ncbi:MAG: phospholipid carrier-dependent glycosyltransferase [Acidimicrobiales bacterium]